MSDLDQKRRDLARALEGRRGRFDGRHRTFSELIEMGPVLDDILGLLDEEAAQSLAAARAEDEKRQKAEADAVSATRTAIAKVSKAIAEVPDEHKVTALAALIDAAAEAIPSQAHRTDRIVPPVRVLLARVGNLVAEIERRDPNAQLRAAFVAEILAPRAR